MSVSSLESFFGSGAWHSTLVPCQSVQSDLQSWIDHASGAGAAASSPEICNHVSTPLNFMIAQL